MSDLPQDDDELKGLPELFMAMGDGEDLVLAKRLQPAAAALKDAERLAGLYFSVLHAARVQMNPAEL